jgi:hypothetical protein
VRGTGGPFRPSGRPRPGIGHRADEGQGAQARLFVGPAGRAPLRAAEAGRPQADPGAGCSGAGHPGRPQMAGSDRTGCLNCLPPVFLNCWREFSYHGGSCLCISSCKDIFLHLSASPVIIYS